jgi:cytidine deaminase
MNAPLSVEEARRLLGRGKDAMRLAVAPVSAFPVGAALRTAGGDVFVGCNVESRSLLQVVCAERVALLNALSAGARQFTHIAVTAAKAAPISPCGLCRQMLAEFAPDVIVVSEDATGEIVQRPLADYFPFPFKGP